VSATTAATLREACDELQIPWRDEWFVGLEAHVRLLEKWAPRVNLVSMSDLPHVWTRHVLDSLSLLSLDAVQTARGRAIDIGSGAGFPGIPLAVARPDLDWTLLEPRKKRGAFLTQAIMAARLKQTRWLSGRLPDPSLLGFDLVVSRATFAPPELLERVRPLLATGGVAVVMAATAPEVPPGFETLESRPLRFGGADRFVASFRPRPG